MHGAALRGVDTNTDETIRRYRNPGSNRSHIVGRFDIHNTHIAGDFQRHVLLETSAFSVITPRAETLVWPYVASAKTHIGCA